MGARGPAPTCRCGRCPKCRKREIARRHYHGDPPLNPRRFRASTLQLPDDPAVIGYIAGIVDGEGCITRANGRWRLQVAMTDEPLIAWLGTFGGTVRERSVLGNRQRCWRWLLMRQVDVRLCLLELAPHLRAKREHAAAVVTDIERDLPPELLEVRQEALL